MSERLYAILPYFYLDGRSQGADLCDAHSAVVNRPHRHAAMIRVIHGGQLHTGEDEFLIQEHSGHTPDLTDRIRELLTDYEASLLDQGDWVMVIDGCTHLIEAGNHPEFIRVTGDVSWDILNFGGSADELIVSGTDDCWVTIADGEVVEEGTFHPFLISA